MRGRTRTIWLASSAVATAALVGTLLSAQADGPRHKPYTTWSDYGGSPDSMQYSALTQIDTANVSRLELAWHYPVPDRTGNFGFNPLVVDLNEGTIKWRAPFGTSPALAARGVTNTGNARRAWRNGPVVTAGGLIFLGSWADRTVRAFDARNGKLLWEHPLKANPEGIVSVFEVNGRQYVAFCASGSATEETPIAEAYESLLGLASAQGYYVFALPQTSQMRTP